jgi:hypothetical protein
MKNLKFDAAIAQLPQGAKILDSYVDSTNMFGSDLMLKVEMPSGGESLYAISDDAYDDELRWVA